MRLIKMLAVLLVVLLAAVVIVPLVVLAGLFIWLKLTEVNVAYTLPANKLGWFRNTGLSQMRLEVTGRDLFTWSNYSGLDPEVGSVTTNNLTRIDNIQQPRYRRFSTVLNLTF